MRSTGRLALACAGLALVGCQSTGDLGGTSWNAVEVISTSPPAMADLDVEFGTDGWVTSTVLLEDGSTQVSRRKYSVHRSLLTVFRPDEGDLELLHRFDGGELVLTDENFQARLRRTN